MGHPLKRVEKTRLDFSLVVLNSDSTSSAMVAFSGNDGNDGNDRDRELARREEELREDNDRLARQIAEHRRQRARINQATQDEQRRGEALVAEIRELEQIEQDLINQRVCEE